MRITPRVLVLLIVIAMLSVGASDVRPPCEEMRGWAGIRYGTPGDEELLRGSRVVAAEGVFDVSPLGQAQEFWSPDGRYFVYARFMREPNAQPPVAAAHEEQFVLREHRAELGSLVVRDDRDEKFILADSPAFHGEPLAFRWIDDDSLIVTVRATCQEGEEYTFDCLIDVAAKKFIWTLDARFRR